MSAADIFNGRLIKAADRLREAQGAYLAAVHDAATAERLYKLGESVAMLKVDDYKNADDRRAQTETLVIELEPEPGAPRIRVTVNALRYACHLAEGKRDAAKLAVQNYRTEMSALMSLMALERSEAEFAKWAPHESVGA